MKNVLAPSRLRQNAIKNKKTTLTTTTLKTDAIDVHIQAVNAVLV